MIIENELLDYHSFTLRIGTLANGEKEIHITACKEKDEPLFEKSMRVSAMELKYFNFEHSKVLDYAMSAFLFNMRKKQHDNS